MRVSWQRRLEAWRGGPQIAGKGAPIEDLVCVLIRIRGWRADRLTALGEPRADGSACFRPTSWRWQRSGSFRFRRRSAEVICGRYSETFGVPRAANAAVAESFGLPVAEIRGLRRFGDRWGIWMSRVEGPSFADAIRARRDLTSAYLKEMALLQLRVHSHPGAYFSSLKSRLDENIRRADGLDVTTKLACWRK